MNDDEMNDWIDTCEYDDNDDRLLYQLLLLQNGRTALHLASYYGHLSVLRTLIEFNADIHVQDEVRMMMMMMRLMVVMKMIIFLVVVVICGGDDNDMM